MQAINQSLYNSLCQVKQLIMLAEQNYQVTTQKNVSSIGKHVRHIINHFDLFRASFDSMCIDYNYRTRESFVEKNPHVALDKIETLLDWIENQPITNQSVKLISEVDFFHNQSIEMQSTIQREALYIINHTIHHVAYISLILKILEIKVPKYLGLACSTATYLREAKTKKTG